MQWCILQELRRTPLDPCVRHIAEPCSKLIDQPRLADARLADDEQELPLARVGPFPSAGHDAKVLFAADKRGENPGARSAAAATDAHDAIERHRNRDALEFMRAPVLDDEEPGNLPVNGSGDQDG